MTKLNQGFNEELVYIKAFKKKEFFSFKLYFFLLLLLFYYILRRLLQYCLLECSMFFKIGPLKNFAKSHENRSEGLQLYLKQLLLETSGRIFCCNLYRLPCCNNSKAKRTSGDTNQIKSNIYFFYKFSLVLLILHYIYMLKIDNSL